MAIKDLIGLSELGATLRQLEQRLQRLEEPVQQLDRRIQELEEPARQAARLGKRLEAVTQRSDEQFQAVKKHLGLLTGRIDDYLEYSRRYSRPIDYAADDAFYRLASSVVEQRRTMLKYDRLHVLWQAVKNACPLGAAAAEVGSYRGGSAYFIAAAFLELGGREHPLHVFDTFEGHPGNKLTEFDAAHSTDKFTDTSYDDVRAYLSRFERVSVYKGEFSATVGAVDEPSFGLVHIDVDLYQVTLDCLAYFGPRLVPGGVVVVDDFGTATCPGVARAIDEYLGEGHEYQVWDMKTDQLVLVRR